MFAIDKYLYIVKKLNDLNFFHKNCDANLVDKFGLSKKYLAHKFN